MMALGIFCLIYYLVLRIITKKWDSNFSVFWLAAGAACLGLKIAAAVYPGILRSVLWKLVFIPAAVFVIVECAILLGMRPSKDRKLDYIIVLGAQIQGTRVTDSLVRRLETAKIYLKNHPDTKAIVSGGRGKGEDISEAEAMEGFLTLMGIKKERIIRENRSTTTRENFLFSSGLVPDKTSPIGIVTNNFHMYRSVRMARRAGFTKVYKIPAGTYAVLFLNYVVREFFAVLKMWIVK